MSTNDLNRLLHATAFGNDVLDHENLFARDYLEPAPQHELSLLLFHENETAAELARDFLTEHEAAHGGRNYRNHFEVPDFVC